MSASAVLSASETFREEFNKYNDIHKELKGAPLKHYINSDSDLIAQINEATALPSDKIIDAVAKKEAFKKLNPVLLDLTSQYNDIHKGITLNNENLEALKVLIQEAITAKTVAAAAAKAAQDASTAAQAQALADARNAIQTQIDELNKLISDRTTASEEALTSKTQRVLHMVRLVIPNKVDGIKNLLLQDEHISQATRVMVEGIDTDITTFISGVDFERIAKPFKGKNEGEIAAIKDQIGTLTGAMSDNDITAMNLAVASTPLPLSTTLVDFIVAADNFVTTTLDTKLGELDGDEARVKAAIAVDLKTFQEEEAKITELQSKIDAVVVDSQEITAIIESIDDKIKVVESKYGEVNNFTATTPQLTKSTGNMKYHTSITNLNAEILKLDNQTNALLPSKSFDTIKQQLNDIQSARTSRGINAPSSLSILNQKIQGFQDKRKEFNDKYNEHHANHERISAALLQSRSPSPGGTAAGPIVPASPSGVRPSSAAPRNPTAAAAAAGRASPKQGWVKDQTLKPIPIDNEQPDAADADIASEPVTPPAPIIGARRNFLYVSHNTEPKTAYLVVVKKPRLDNSQGGGGGNKNYHVQKGGAPPPDVLPEDSEIFPIDVDNKGFVDVMAGLLPPKLLLTVSDDGTQENKIITNIRGGRRPKGDLNELYDNIKNELITDENQNPLTIGLRAVYYPNVIKLVRLLDFNLGHGGMSYEEMFEKLRKFMDFTDGTFGVLDALYKDTFHQGSLAPPPLPPISPPGSPPGSPRLSPREPLKKIDSALKTKGRDAKEEIKKIVGWTSNIENTNFNMLKNMFSKNCTHTRIPNTFLSDINKLGSSPYSHHKFRLNWIILLAFHSYYNKQSILETVGKLIASLYNAFLGWLATSSYQDTFTRLFNKTLPIDPTTKYSEIFKKQLTASLNSENLSYKDVYTLVQNINDKMCELQENRNPAIDVPHNDEYDDEMNDPDYVPHQEGDDSDDDSVRSSELAEAAAELRGLSRPEQGLGRTRSQQLRQLPSFTPRRGRMTPEELRQSERLPPPDGDPHPDLDDISDVEEFAERPTVSPLTLPGGQSQSGPLSDRTGDQFERRLKSLAQLKNMGVRHVGKLPPGPARPSSSPSSSQSGSVSERLGAVSMLHPRANRDVEMRPGALPLAVIEQQQRSQPAVITTGPRKQLSVGLSYRPQPAAPASTPAPAPTPAPTPALKPNPPSTVNANFGRTSASSSRRLPGFGNYGGNNKKRTRKHKKHTSISASRRPTRRRRIPPTEGHKYTRKRPRT